MPDVVWVYPEANPPANLIKNVIKKGAALSGPFLFLPCLAIAQIQAAIGYLTVWPPAACEVEDDEGQDNCDTDGA